MRKLVKITKESGIPLIGCIAFGVIDRGTNLLQVRPNTLCPLSCIFCSTDAGPNSKYHNVNYEVELEYLVKGIKDVVAMKGGGIEINLDSMGEVMAYLKFFELVEEISKMKNVERISMQTNGYYLTEKKVDELEKLGVNQINLSIDTLDNEFAKELSGCKAYDLRKIKKLAEYINKSKVELLIAPVWVPKLNDKDIVELINYCKELKCKIGIQKYDIYKYGRKVKGKKQINWWKFYEQLKKWEKEYSIQLVLSRENMNIEKRERVESSLRKGEVVSVEIKAEGWLKGQMLGVAKGRCVSVNSCVANINDRLNVKVLEDKNSIYIAEPKG